LLVNTLQDMNVFRLKDITFVCLIYNPFIKKKSLPENKRPITDQEQTGFITIKFIFLISQCSVFLTKESFDKRISKLPYTKCTYKLEMFRKLINMFIL